MKEWFWIIVILGGCCAYLYFKYRRRPDMLCLRCHTVAEPKKETDGSGCVEVFLWLAFIVPGILYSLWRSSSTHGTCYKCGSRELVPLDSPRTMEILGEQEPLYNEPQRPSRLARAEDFLPPEQQRRQDNEIVRIDHDEVDRLYRDM